VAAGPTPYADRNFLRQRTTDRIMGDRSNDLIWLASVA
jgi:hypothetical protein